MKLRISLTEKHGEIKGTIQSEGDGLFRLECLAMIIERLAQDTSTTPEELCRDAISLLNRTS